MAQLIVVYWQDHLQALLLSGHGVEQRAALVGLEPGLQRGDDRGIDRQRHVDQRLHAADRLGQNSRLVGQRDAGVDIEHVGAGLHLGDRIGLDRREIAGRHLRRQTLAPGRIDALANHAERPVEADDDFLLGGRNDCFAHTLTSCSRRRGVCLRTPGMPPFAVH